MIRILRPSKEDSIDINELIKSSWLETYTVPKIGVTREDVDQMYEKYSAGQIKALNDRAINPQADDISLVAKENNKVMGYIRFKILSEEIELRTLYVHPKNTGRGIGTKLWQESLLLLPSDKIIFTEPVENTKSINFYKKIGFKDTGEKYKAPDSMPNSGIQLPLIKMTYRK
jgi:ribosomal protein S18 acetylase RimI-like enzyme